jgi:hypothetical protein
MVPPFLFSCCGVGAVPECDVSAQRETLAPLDGKGVVRTGHVRYRLIDILIYQQLVVKCTHRRSATGGKEPRRAAARRPLGKFAGTPLDFRYCGK